MKVLIETTWKAIGTQTLWSIQTLSHQAYNTPDSGQGSITGMWEQNNLEKEEKQNSSY